MKTAKQKTQMRWILGTLIAVALILATVGIVLGIKNCSSDDTPPTSNGTNGGSPQYELPMDTF